MDNLLFSSCTALNYLFNKPKHIKCTVSFEANKVIHISFNVSKTILLKISEVILTSELMYIRMNPKRLRMFSPSSLTKSPVQIFKIRYGSA